MKNEDDRDKMWSAYYDLRQATECAFREYVLLGERATNGFYRDQTEQALVAAAIHLGFDLVKREDKQECSRLVPDLESIVARAEYMEDR